MKKLLLSLRRKLRKPSASITKPISSEPFPASTLIAGKNVLITGAGSNIGYNIALEMARQGARIYFTNIDPNQCHSLKQKLETHSVRSIGFVSDISKIEDVDTLHKKLIQENISIDILIHNAGLQIETSTIKKLQISEWRRTFDTNLFGPLHLSKLISLDMIDRSIPGSILFITSIHQWLHLGWPSYSASKAAVGMVIKELAVDLAAHAIRVNGIAPGWVEEDPSGLPKRSKFSVLHHTSINPGYIGRAAVYLS